MTYRVCAMHFADGGVRVRARAEPLYDPLSGERIPIDLCQGHRRIVAGLVVGYRSLLAEFTPDVDEDLVCRAKRADGMECGYPARTRQGLSRHEVAEHPDPNVTKCEECGEPTTNMKTHMWREHPDGKDAEAVDQLAARTRVYQRCEVGSCEAGPFMGAVAYTSHLTGRHPKEAPRCPVGCRTATLMPDRHIRHRHGIVVFRAWVAEGRPGIKRLRPRTDDRPEGLIAGSGRVVAPKDFQSA